MRIIAVGDVSLNGRYGRLLAQQGPEHLFSSVLPCWALADLRLGNLESPLTDASRVAPSKVALRGSPGATEALRRAGFDALTLANNHTMDYGPGGLAETCERLDAAGLPHHGAGRDESSAAAPLVLRRGGRSIGLLAFCDVEQASPLYAGPDTPGVAALRVEEASRAVADLRPRVDWLIVQLHWGLEMAQIPSPSQRAIARRLVGAGADLILGHHPHVLQPMEWMGGVPVFYSLGNFLFSDMYWRGRTTAGEPFVSRLRLHPLSRGTGWAEVILRAGAPAEIQFHPVRLGRDLTIRPEETQARCREWDDLARRLEVTNYDAEYAAEAARAEDRTRWRWAWKSLPRRIEAKLFQYGLIPNAVEGT